MMRGAPLHFKKKSCRLCAEKVKAIDYKECDMLKRFTTERGKILPSRFSGNCAKHQRLVSRAIKRARIAALLPFISD